MNGASERFEVAVLGGGMVDATLAAIFGRAGIRTVLLEEQPPQHKWPERTVDIRVSAFTMTSRTMLETLGVCDKIAGLGAGPYRSMRVWDPAGGGESKFDAADVGRNILGFIVENRVSGAALWEFLEGLPEISIRCPATVARIHPAAQPFQ